MPPILRWEWSVSSPSKRMNRCLPCASTESTGRPASRSGQRSIACRACGVSIATISFPTSTAPTRRAAAWIVSPSGTERQFPRPLAEAELDEQLLDRGADDRLAVEALEGQPLEPPPADMLCESLESLAQPRFVGLVQRHEPLPAALDIERRLSIQQHDVRTGHPCRPAPLVLVPARPRERCAVRVRGVGRREHERSRGLV